MSRLERVLETPLDRRAKQQFWNWAREEYFRLHNPGLAKALGEKGLSSYQVHHLCPMQYLHLFPKLDINGKANLAGLHKDVHGSITAVWQSLGSLSERMRPQDVIRVMEIIKRHYGRWFDRTYGPADAPALARAAQAALREVAELKAPLVP